jgi:cell wall-associated NlpC family hydrolase
MRVQAYGASGSAGGSLKPVTCPVSYPGGAAGKAVSYACSKIGDPYVFATEGPSTFDCSGLTKAAWASAGVSLDHYTGAQQHETTSVSLGNLRAGDLAFYGNPAYHVAIVIGKDSSGKWWVVHAPESGDHVREAQLYSIGTPSGFGRPS